jgi:threonine dehydrogenase-like Zn-dependent dehydrogenase
MKAAVIYEAGGPEVLKIESRPIPTPQPGEVLIRVKAFGLNRSELFTRKGFDQAIRHQQQDRENQDVDRGDRDHAHREATETIVEVRAQQVAQARDPSFPLSWSTAFCVGSCR